MIGVFFANGFEEIEALTVVDVLRRAGLDVKMISCTGEITVTGAHNIPVMSDRKIEDVKADELTAIVLPGGMPGTTNLMACERLQSFLDDAFQKEKTVAAICAAPSILGETNRLQGKKAICYPGFESKLLGAKITDERVVKDGNVITSKGPGTALEFALELVRLFCGDDKSESIRNSMIAK